MKKVISILVLLIGFNAIAQKREMKDINPEQYATLATKKMTLALDLNESQQTKIYQMSLDNAISRKAKMAERKKLMESNQTKKRTTDERYAMRSAMLDHQIDQKKKMKSILSNEQFQKWEKMNHKRKDMLHKRRDGKKDGARKNKME